MNGRSGNAVTALFFSLWNSKIFSVSLCVISLNGVFVRAFGCRTGSGHSGFGFNPISATGGVVCGLVRPRNPLPLAVVMSGRRCRRLRPPGPEVAITGSHPMNARSSRRDWTAGCRTKPFRVSCFWKASISIDASQKPPALQVVVHSLADG